MGGGTRGGGVRVSESGGVWVRSLVAGGEVNIANIGIAAARADAPAAMTPTAGPAIAILNTMRMPIVITMLIVPTTRLMLQRRPISAPLRRLRHAMDFISRALHGRLRQQRSRAVAGYHRGVREERAPSRLGSGSPRRTASGTERRAVLGDRVG